MGMGAYAFGDTVNSPRPVRPVTLSFPQNTNFTKKNALSPVDIICAEE